MLHKQFRKDLTLNYSTSVESGQITELIKIGNLYKAKSLVKAVLVKELYNLEAMLLLSEIAEKQYCRLEAIHILRKILMNEHLIIKRQKNCGKLPRRMKFPGLMIILDILSIKKKLYSVLYFSLIWNMFEGIVCNNNASICTMEHVVTELVSRKELESAKFDSYLAYFRNRYTTD